MTRDARDSQSVAAATPPSVRRQPRFRSFSFIPALLLALLGIAGLVPTIRTTPPPPPLRDPIRYPSGGGAAERLVIILAPQLNERELVLLRSSLTPDRPEGTIVSVDRPSFMSFEDSSFVLLAGNGPSAAAPPAPADQPPDTLVRSIVAQGKQVRLIGPADWRALFGLVEASPATSNPPNIDALLNETASALALRDAPLVMVLLRDLAGRDLRDEPGNLRAMLSNLGTTLSPQDAVLLVGGGGAIGEPLRLSISGAGTKISPTRTLDLNDVAPTCAVLIGAAYPSEARGRIAWSLLAADDRRKAEATAGLSRQRATLAISAIPFGVQYPNALRILINQLADADAEIAAKRYDYAYQLAASHLDQADRQLVALAGATPLPTPRRAAWGLVIPPAAVALLAIGTVLLSRAWGTLGASVAGGLGALAIWLAFVILLRRVIVPNLATVVALTAFYTLCGSTVSAWLARHWSRPRPAFAIDFLVLLAAIPAAVCAYRYGLPWRLRLEEATPLFLWRSALLAPIGLLVTGYAFSAILARLSMSKTPRQPL